VEGRELIEYNNKPFVNLAIRIHDAVQNAKKYESHDIMRYIKSASNSKTIISFYIYYGFINESNDFFKTFHSAN